MVTKILAFLVGVLVGFLNVVFASIPSALRFKFMVIFFIVGAISGFLVTLSLRLAGKNVFTVQELYGMAYRKNLIIPFLIGGVLGMAFTTFVR